MNASVSLQLEPIAPTTAPKVDLFSLRPVSAPATDRSSAEMLGSSSDAVLDIDNDEDEEVSSNDSTETLRPTPRLNLTDASPNTHTNLHSNLNSNPYANLHLCMSSRETRRCCCSEVKKGAVDLLAGEHVIPATLSSNVIGFDVINNICTRAVPRYLLYQDSRNIYDVLSVQTIIQRFD